MNFNKKIISNILLMSISVLPIASYAGGIALGKTRIIYPLNAKEASIQVTNSSKENKFLIQSWIENKQGEKTSDFVVTPPLFVSNPTNENILRLTYLGVDLPKDKETLYWFNSKSIPSINYEKVKDINVLQVAVQSRIKIFMRPLNLPYSSEEAFNHLVFKKDLNDLIITNNSPYYINMVNLKLGENSLNSTMIPPKDQVALSIRGMSGNLSYQTINDYGATTETKTIILK